MQNASAGEAEALANYISEADTIGDTSRGAPLQDKTGDPDGAIGTVDRASGAIYRETTLEVVIAWRDDLRARIARAALRFELIGGFDEAEQTALEIEVEEFKRLCRAIKWLSKLEGAA
jgi:hypothetical protein